MAKFGIAPLPPGASLAQPSILLATWFGAGLLRPAPGTLGTLAGLPFGYLLASHFGFNGLAAAAFILLVVGTVAANVYGRKSGVSDDQSIVVDEVVGVWIAGLVAGDSIGLWIIAFLLFRLFDIWKPWPVSFFDKRSSGFDTMMDDVLAGVYALFGVAIAAPYF